MRKFAIYFLLFFLISVPQIQCADGISSFLFRPVADSYEHAETGLIFPAFIGEFTKNRVTVNRNPVIGTTVRYVNESGTCADVYLFTMEASDQEKDVPEKNFKAAFDMMSANILKLPALGISVIKVSQLPAEDLKTDSSIPHLKSLFQIQTKSETLDSLLVMTQRRKHLLKIRVSWSTAASEEKDDAVLFVNHILQLVGDAMTLEKMKKNNPKENVKAELPLTTGKKVSPEHAES